MAAVRWPPCATSDGLGVGGSCSPARSEGCHVHQATAWAWGVDECGVVGEGSCSPARREGGHVHQATAWAWGVNECGGCGRRQLLPCPQGRLPCAPHNGLGVGCRRVSWGVGGSRCSPARKECAMEAPPTCTSRVFLLKVWTDLIRGHDALSGTGCSVVWVLAVQSMLGSIPSEITASCPA
eukprot:356388-Chlamydomonas_euryale.AAC.6